MSPLTELGTCDDTCTAVNTEAQKDKEVSAWVMNWISCRERAAPIMRSVPERSSDRTPCILCAGGQKILDEDQ